LAYFECAAGAAHAATLPHCAVFRLDKLDNLPAELAGFALRKILAGFPYRAGAVNEITEKEAIAGQKIAVQTVNLMVAVGLGIDIDTV